MKKADYLKIYAILLSMLFLLFPNKSFSQNGTPGNKSGADNTAFLFAAFRYEADRGEDNYLLHVGDVDSSFGQQYKLSVRIENSAPDTIMPINCNLVEFYNIISSQTDSLGIWLITGHGAIFGSTELIAVEAYEVGIDGIMARDAQAARYINGTVDPSVPPFKRELILAQHM